MVSWQDPISLNGNGFLMMGLEDLPPSWRLQCASELSSGVTHVSFYWDGRRKYWWKQTSVMKYNNFYLWSEILTTLHGMVGDRPVSQLWRIRRQPITCTREDQVPLTWSGHKTIWYGRYRRIWSCFLWIRITTAYVYSVLMSSDRRCKYTFPRTNKLQNGLNYQHKHIARLQFRKHIPPVNIVNVWAQFYSNSTSTEIMLLESGLKTSTWW